MSITIGPGGSLPWWHRAGAPPRIGRALIATAEKDFAQRGIRRVALDTRLTREDAHKFYESLGYERNGWRFVKQLPVSN